MHRHLLATTAMTAAIALPVLASSAAAQDITTARTTPAATSTIANGAPGNLRITSAGSVVVSTGTAVTQDSNNTVLNEGTIRISNADNAVGIAATAGTNGTITNTGTITVDENYTATDGDNDGDLDGPFALGSGRYGIRTLGAHSGAITNTGTITAEGNNSYGIALGGLQTGNVINNGTVQVLGNNSVGMALGDVAGNVRIAGTVGARGANAVGAHLAGDLTGRLEVQSVLTATGYRSTTAPANTAALDADDLLQGGPALLVEGNVTGGIVVAVPPRDADANNPDEDSDGIPDANEGSGQIQSFGAAPALLIGASDRGIAVGPLAGTASQYGLQVDGTVRGTGVYSGISATGIQIGGRGGNVAIANGIGIAGTVGATAVNANATGLRIGAGAQTPLIHVTGTVEASANNAATASATAILVEAGANVPTIRNAGKVRAGVGADGMASAIIDLSGNVTLIENSGLIAATGASATSTRNVAIDLSANTTGATLRQTVVGAGIAAPSIEGDVKFGTGSDVFDLADGTYKGMAIFGGGGDRLTLSGDAVFTGTARFAAGVDTLSLAGTSVFSGLADFGGGADILTLAGTARFAGTLANSSGLAVTMTGGVLDVTAPATIASLNVSGTSVLVATLDKDAGEGTFLSVAGEASFGSGARLAVRVADLDNAEGTYAILQAGTLTGANNLQITETTLPFLFKATLGVDTLANRLSVTIARRSATELDLNAAQSSAYTAIFAALQQDEQIEDLFLATTDADSFRRSLNQILPDHAGGTFDGLSLGLRTLARHQAEATGPVYSLGGLDIILNAAVWNSSKDAAATSGYDLAGLGASAAAEVDTGVGSFGLSLGWIFNDYDQGTDLASVYSHSYELALYWRGQWDGITAFARGSVGKANFKGERTLRGNLGNTPVERTATGDWSGSFTSASGGVSYETGGTFFLRPSVSFDYLSLSEKAFTDTGGGRALNLSVDKRQSDELAVNGGITAGIDFTGTRPRDANWFRVEGEAGWREIVGGALGATTARFEGGTAFTIMPEEREGGWYARARAMGGNRIFELGGELGVEQRSGNVALSLRSSLRMGF